MNDNVYSHYFPLQMEEALQYSKLGKFFVEANVVGFRFVCMSSYNSASLDKPFTVDETLLRFFPPCSLGNGERLTSH